MAGVNVTRNAWNKMYSIMKSSKNQFGFLFSASAGGCNGFNFNLNLLDENTYKELNNTRFINVLTQENATLFIDPFSEMHLLGTTIDYVTEDIENGSFDSKFVFNIDKKIASSCGCGTSFMPRDIRQ
tara:strand:- start:1640 stop:2020 length:381 start_codon:yes stop_codon:yes gene_type:complete